MNLRDIDSTSFPASTSVPDPLPGSQRCSGIWCQLGYTPAFDWTCYDLKVDGLPAQLDGKRIVHLTDLHLTSHWSRGYDRLIEQVKNDPPELILITGDFVDDKLDHRDALPTLERFLTQLSARCGIFGILGNHDGDLIAPRLPGLGVTEIQNRYLTIPVGDGSIELAGLPGVKRRDFDPSFVESLPQRTPGVPRIILGHYPDQIRFVGSARADAMLVGHTHGGQICLPNKYAMLTHDRLPHRMARGVHRFGQTLLFVNRGFGTTKFPVRIFCPAEVIELRLQG